MQLSLSYIIYIWHQTKPVYRRNKMKLTEKIKEKIDNAKSEEEVKTILENVREEAEDAGLILDEEELDKATGGAVKFRRY